MKIINFCIAVLLFVSFGNISAQNTLSKSDDLGRIILNTYVSDQVEGLPAGAKKMLENKINSITSKHGMGGSALNPRFIMTPNITVLSKDITPTTPPMIALNLEITFYVGDGIDGIKFSSRSVEVKGVGKNENKAYMSAIKRINTSNPAFKALIEDGKEKIIEYYNSNCDFIIKRAKTLSVQNKHDVALMQLTSVPEVCKECFDKCMDEVEPIYKKQIDRDCKMKLAEAKNAWNQGQDLDAAIGAGHFLSGIEPESACYDEAQALVATISKRVKELDQRNWNFKLKKHDDQVDLHEQTIEAARQVGVAHGENQPETVYNIDSWF